MLPLRYLRQKSYSSRPKVKATARMGRTVHNVKQVRLLKDTSYNEEEKPASKTEFRVV
jgi:hypothetical protein